MVWKLGITVSTGLRGVNRRLWLLKQVFCRYLTRRWNAVDVDASIPENVDVNPTTDRKLIEHFSQMFSALADHRERMWGGVVVASETVVAVGDALDPRPDSASQKLHVLNVRRSVGRHHLTETTASSTSSSSSSFHQLYVISNGGDLAGIP